MVTNLQHNDNEVMQMGSLSGLGGGMAAGGPGGFDAGGKQLPTPFLFGNSQTMLELKRKIALVANTDVPVLLTGESGTGKETLAVEIHRMSRRGPNPFEKVNSAAIPGALMESELFGFERGAFTGAVQRRTGKFQQASTGTIFLDEIADLDLALQAKLLHVLQDGNLSLIGSSEEVNLDTRVICSTNRELNTAVKTGQFQQDLFYQINVMH